MRSCWAFRCVVLAVVFIIAWSAALHAEPADIDAVRAHKIVAVWRFADKSEMRKAFDQNLDVLEFAYGKSVKFLTDAESLEQLRAQGYDIEVEIPDIVEFNLARLEPTLMGGYRTFAEIVATMDTIHNLNPAISTARFSIGQSIEGRDMWVMKISDNAEIDEDEPEILFTAATHAREVITPAVVLETMRKLIQQYGTDTMITRLVDTREIYFMPCFNVDGYVYNQTTNPGGSGMWRKNRRNNGGGWYGVDLNRNFPYMWGYDNQGSSPTPSQETFRGTSAGSEPEIQNYINFVEGRHFTIVLNYHSYSNLILWPWGYETGRYTPEEDLFKDIGDSISEFNGYTPTVGWGLYPTNGDSDDWLYGEQTTKNKIYGFTFEVGSSSDYFWPPTYRIPQLVAENITPNLFLIDICANPQLVARPLPPEWTVADSVDYGFFDLTWSQPDNGNQVISFDMAEYADPQRTTENAESGTSHWDLKGFYNNMGRVYEGTHGFHSSSGDNVWNTMTSLYPMRVEPGDALQFYTWYEIETNYDYAYVEVSTGDESQFVPLPGNITTTYNPYGLNRGNGITGNSGAWVHGVFDLSAYVGKYIYLRFSYNTDGGTYGSGFYVDLISPVGWFTQTASLAAGYPDSTFAVAGRPVGDYFFSLRSTDSQGQQSSRSALKVLHVTSEVRYGDLSNDGAVNPVDVVLLVNFVYKSGAPPAIWGSQYINGDSLCNPVDVVYLVNHVYKGAPPPLGYGQP